MCGGPIGRKRYDEEERVEAGIEVMLNREEVWSSQMQVALLIPKF